MDNVANQATFTDADTGEVIMGLFFGPPEEGSELAMIENDSVSYTLEIQRAMRINPQTIVPGANRRKAGAQGKARMKEMISVVDAECEPLASASDISDATLLKVRIDETVEYAQELEDGMAKAVLFELSRFVLKEIKSRDDLSDLRSELQANVAKSQGDCLTQSLYRLSAKL
jgi:hypothetical protein